jgi:hypothetical protein
MTLDVAYFLVLLLFIPNIMVVIWFPLALSCALTTSWPIATWGHAFKFYYLKNKLARFEFIPMNVREEKCDEGEGKKKLRMFSLYGCGSL